MRLLDTNIILRFLVAPPTPEERRKQQACAALFRRVESGQEEIATSEVVIAEVLYVLCSSRQPYKLSHQDAADRLRPILALSGLHLPQKRVFARALDLFAAWAFLDFEDALLAARMEQQGVEEIYSYDTDFDRVPGITRLEP